MSTNYILFVKFLIQHGILNCLDQIKLKKYNFFGKKNKAKLIGGKQA